MRILILNHTFRYLAGSEINALQLANALKFMGHQVVIGTLLIGERMHRLADLNGVEVVDLLNDEQASLNYDLVWAHHAPILTHVLCRKNLSNCRLLFSSLSPLTPLESPPVFFRDLHCLLVHSQKNQTHLLELGASPERLHLFPNFAPPAFFEKTKKPDNRILRRIAVVSNHLTPEVRQMSVIARSHGIVVDFIGLSGKILYVDEHVLLPYDVVVSIGKTAQYCFAQKIPFFCYDHFGGPGYLNPENFETAHIGNFCGRSFRRKLTGIRMYQQIIDEYPKACGDLDYLRSKAELLFDLRVNLAALWPKLVGLPVTDTRALGEANQVANRLNDIYIGEFRHRLAMESSRWWGLADPLRKLRDWWATHPRPRRLVSKSFSLSDVDGSNVGWK